MLRFLFSALLLIHLSLYSIDKGETAHENRMLADLGYINKIFEESYAPAEWKREHFGWDLQSQFQSAVEEIKSHHGKNIKQFQKSLVNFCSSARDYHVAVTFVSTEHATLPFDVRYRNGKYIITEVEKEESLPIEIGDEILAMNGISMEEVLFELRREAGVENRVSTDRGLALEILTKRNGRLGYQVPQGTAVIKVKKQSSAAIATYEIAWNYKPERVLTPFLNPLSETLIENPSSFGLEERLDRESAIPYYKEMKEAFPDNGQPQDMLGARKSVFSALGNEKLEEIKNEKTTEEFLSWLWNWFLGNHISDEAKKFFDAKLIELPSGKHAGFLRISTFLEEEPEEALHAFRSAIEFFQRKADMLLIDQTNNPGGSALYMYALASMLTDRPLIGLKERKLLTQNDILKAINDIDFIKLCFEFDIFRDRRYRGFLLSELYENLLKESYYILDQWERGHLLTDPYPFEGIEVINPHPKANFTKPIFILTNEMAFSCGDEFPVLLQDNKRATIIGTPTSGAGGSVAKLSFKNLNGINALHYTTSVDYRLDGTLIENHGVNPDIFFDFNNELYDKDDVIPDFSKIYDILDKMTTSR